MLPPSSGFKCSTWTIRILTMVSASSSRLFTSRPGAVFQKTWMFINTAVPTCHWSLHCFRRDLSTVIYIFTILLNILTFLFTPLYYYKFIRYYNNRRSQWPCGLRPGSKAARFQGLWVRKTSRAWSVVCCQVEVSRPEYPTECVFECDLKASTMKRPWPIRGCRATKKNYYNNLHNARRMICYFKKSS